MFRRPQFLATLIVTAILLIWIGAFAGDETNPGLIAGGVAVLVVLGAGLYAAFSGGSSKGGPK